MQAGPTHWACLIFVIGAGLCPPSPATAAPDPNTLALGAGDPAARAEAAIRIAEAGQCSDEAMGMLLALLADRTRLPSPATAPAAWAESATVGDVAANALGRLGAAAVEALIASLSDPTYGDAHGRIVNLLGTIAPRQAASAVLRYVQRHVAGRRPWDVNMSVAWLGRDGAPTLIQALNTDVLELQVVAARDLGDMGEPRALGALLATARRLAPLAADMPADYKQRRKIVLFRAAVPSIAKLGGPQSFEQIRRWQSSLSGCWDVATRRALILAVAYTADDRAAAVLLAVLDSDDPQARRIAVDALGLLAHPAVTRAMIGVLDDDDPVVRAKAVTALGAMSDPAAVDALIGRLTDTAPEVRGRAAAALAQIAGVDLGPDPAIWQHWRDERIRLRNESQPAKETAAPTDTTATRDR